MNWKIKKITVFLCVIFVYRPIHAGLHVLRDNLDQLVDDLNVLEVRLTEEVIKNRQLAEVQRRKLEQQQRIDLDKRLRQEELNRLPEQRKREIKAQLDEQLRLKQERERQAAERKRLEEQELLDRAKRELEEEQKRLAQVRRKREIEDKRQEKLRLQQEKARQKIQRKELEEQERIAQEQRKREPNAKQRVDLRLEQTRAKLAAVRQRLKEKDELSFSRMTAVPYDVGGDWVGKFVEEIDPSGKLSALDYGGYIFLGSSSLFKGSRHRPENQSEQILENYYKPKNLGYFNLPNKEKRKRKAELKEVKKDLVALYKIHLMPQNANDFMIILEKFIKALNANPQLQNAVNTLKVKSNLDFEDDPAILREKLIKQWGNEVPPIIVIAPSLGKQNAQIVLDTVYNLFKDIKGLDLTPRFNEKITDLIYYAQGNSNDKQARPEYFTPDTILYNPDFVSKKDPEDYHLQNPAAK